MLEKIKSLRALIKMVSWKTHLLWIGISVVITVAGTILSYFVPRVVEVLIGILFLAAIIIYAVFFSSRSPETITACVYLACAATIGFVVPRFDQG